MSATTVVEAILRELNGRRGFRQNWDEIDEEIQEEIREALTAIVHAGADQTALQVEVEMLRDKLTQIHRLSGIDDTDTD